jgi:ribosomal protein S4
MNYTGPKVKISRKIGINITPKAGKYTQKKAYPPGQFGAQKRRAKQSDYGKQLLEKQRLRLQYNLSEKQMEIIMKKHQGWLVIQKNLSCNYSKLV